MYTTVISEPHCQNRAGTIGLDNGFEGEVEEMRIPAQFSLKTVSDCWLEDEQGGSSSSPRKSSQ